MALAACGDEVTDPEAFLESAEAEAVMRSAEALPLLPALMERAAPATTRDGAVLIRASELWAAGAVRDGRSTSRRRLAVRYAAPVLAGSLPPEDWEAVEAGMEDWMVTVEAMLQHLSIPEVGEHLDAARRYLDRAAYLAADPSRSAYYRLLAMAELVETTPRYVALGMVLDAREALDRASDRAEADPEAVDRRTMERAQRLKDWAERAVQEEDYLLAIQRAYYATQLMEGP